MPGVPADRTGSPTAARSEAVRAAAAVLGDLAQFDVPIGPLTTYRVGGAGRRCSSGSVTLDDLAVLASAVQVSGLPVLVLGRGSNLLVADAGFEGIVVSATAVTDGFEIDDEQRRSFGPGRRSRFRSWHARRRPAASPGSSGPSAFRVRSAGRCG